MDLKGKSNGGARHDSGGPGGGVGVVTANLTDIALHAGIHDTL